MALYISTYDQLIELNNNYNSLNYKFRYIFINEKLLLKDNIVLVKELRDKIRFTEEINHYDEISKYLDNVLEKEDKGNKLVKSI